MTENGRLLGVPWVDVEGFFGEGLVTGGAKAAENVCLGWSFTGGVGFVGVLRVCGAAEGAEGGINVKAGVVTVCFSTRIGVVGADEGEAVCSGVWNTTGIDPSDSF
jgi:hypothetical protein